MPLVLFDDDDDVALVSFPFFVFSLITREAAGDGRYADAGFLHGLRPCLSKTHKESSSDTIISWTMISRVKVASDKRRVVFKNSYNPTTKESKMINSKENMRMLH